MQKKTEMKGGIPQMEIVAENPNETVQYMIRGPNIDWGIISLKPGEEKPAHFHEKLAETFYVFEGTMTFVLASEEIDIPKGMAIRLEAHESHGLKNQQAGGTARLIFIKESYIPNDKVDCA